MPRQHIEKGKVQQFLSKSDIIYRLAAIFPVPTLMIFSPPLVAATAQPFTGSKIKEGIGRVERQIDRATYVIAFGREKVTVSVTAGALTAGEQVFVTARRDGMVIERLDASSGSGVPAGSDSFLRLEATTRPALDCALQSIVTSLTQGKPDTAVLRQSEALFSAVAAECSSINPTLTAEIASVLGALARPDAAPGDAAEAAVLIERLRNQIMAVAGPEGRFIALKQAIAEGIYSFSTVEDALRFMGGDESAAGRLTAALDASGAIIIRVSSIGNQTLAALLQPADVLRELAAWNAASQSRVFQSLSAETLEQLFIGRGSLPLDRLRLLDAFAAAMQLPAASGRGGNAVAQSASLGQWLDAAVDVRAAPSALAARAPVFSISSMIDALNDLAAVNNPSPAAQPPILLPDAAGITAAVLRDSAGRATVFGAAFARLGFDLEHTLEKGGAPDKNSLKQLLMQLLRASGETASGPTLDATRESAAQRELTMARCALEQTVMSFIDKSLSAPAGTAADNAGTAGSTYEAIAERLRGLLSAMGERIEGLLADAKLLASGAPIKDTTGRCAVPPEVAESFIRDARARLESLLENLVLAVEQALRRFLPSVAPITLMAPPLFQEIEELGQRLLRAAEASLREALQSGPARHVNSATADTLPGKEQDRVAQVPPLTDRALLRQTVERMINRVESLQLLARQTTTASGDQQILALPVKIGDEWTEMHVRFIRQRTGKPGGDPRRYTVFVNVAPSLLGAIDARLDYQDKKSLSLSLEFESQATYQWFIDRKAPLREAFCALGVPSPRIEIYHPRPWSPEKDDAVSAPASGNTIIDLKA
jgi:hypothetical protein